MGDTSGIGGKESSPVEPSKISPSGSTPGEPSGESVGNVLNTPVQTLGQLKQVLIDNLGEKEGTKFYNSFIKTFMMQVISQMQESSAQARKAAKQMGQTPST